ncbi:hypothetical protein PMAYCL1PPCAC_22481, partial [Pristionchus mayeri]
VAVLSPPRICSSLALSIRLTSYQWPSSILQNTIYTPLSLSHSCAVDQQQCTRAQSFSCKPIDNHQREGVL